MIVDCRICSAKFEDEYRSWVCPHDAFAANDGKNNFTVHDEAYLSKSSEIYDADYFLRGVASGKSLYENYTWLPNLTVPMVQTIVDHCGIKKEDRVLDFGCARGYVVKALRGLGYGAYGIDISEWAIKNADEETKPYLNWSSNGPLLKAMEFDWIIAKDVLEHVPYVRYTVTDLMNAAKCGIFAVVPLSNFDNGKYVISEYEKDITHIQRWTLSTWVEMFMRYGWRVEA